jgi:hypothetical protein
MQFYSSHNLYGQLDMRGAIYANIFTLSVKLATHKHLDWALFSYNLGTSKLECLLKPQQYMQ